MPVADSRPSPAAPRRRHLLVAATCACVVVAGWLVARSLGLLIPSWVSWQTSEQHVDLDWDGTDETVLLGRRVLRVLDADGRELYATPREWRIAQVLVCDVNFDQTPDLVMLAWRRGNYGTSRPFWEKGIDLRMTEHLYVMGLREGEVVPIWMSHELGAPVASMSAGKNGSLVLTTTDGNSSGWVWEDFGFVAA